MFFTIFVKYNYFKPKTKNMKQNLNEKSTMLILMGLMAIDIGVKLFNIYSTNRHQKKYGENN